MRTNAQQTSNRGQTVSKGDRKTGINGSGNSNRTPLHQEFTKLPQESPIQGSNLRGDHTSQQKGERGTDMVEKNLEAKPGEITNNHTSRDHNKLGCLSGGLGSSMCKSNSRGEMDAGGKGILATHQCDGDKSSSTSSTNLLQDTSSKISIAQNRQYNNDCIHLQQGRQQEPENERNCQRAMDVRNTKTSPDISGIYTLQTELGGRQRIQDNRYGRVETLPAAILQDNTNLGSARNRPICIKGNKTNAELHQLQTRPTGPSNRCLSNKMAISTSICVPTFQTIRPSHQQTSKRQNHWDHNYASMAHLPMVSLTTGKSNSQSNTATKATGPTARPSRKPTSNGTKQQIAASGMEGLSRELQNSGISQKTAELMLKSRAPGTTKNYETSWKIFVSWCQQRNLDPIRCSIASVTDFLTERFQEDKLQYKTMNNYRSAISTFHQKIDNYKVGQHPVITQLLKAMSKERPSNPKASAVWDVDLVIDHYRAIENQHLSLTQLTHKAVMLLALVAIPRASELHLLNTQHMIQKHDHIIFQLIGNLKHTKQGKPNKPLIINAFAPDENICPMKTVMLYLQKTKEYRTEQNSQVFLTTVKPHKPARKATIASWILKELGKVGVDTSQYTAHSTRASSSSKVDQKGTPREIILERGNWKGASVWERYYHKPIHTKQKQYADTLLSKPTEQL